MKKLLRTALTIGIIFIFVGGLIFFIGFAASGFNFNTLSGVRHENTTKTESSDTKYDSITIDFDTVDINIVFDQSADAVSISYPLSFNKNGDALNEVTVTESENGIILKERVIWKRGLMFWGIKTPVLTVTIPAERSVSLNLETDTGDIVFIGDGQLENLSISVDTGDIKAGDSEISVTEDVNLESDTGDAKFKSIIANNFIAELDTGDLFLGDATVFNNMDISTDTGKINFTGTIIADTIKIDVDTGDVRAKKAVIDAQTITVKSDTGDVSATLAGTKSDYTILISLSTGDSNVENQSGGARSFSLKSSTGDCNVFFTE